MKEVLETQVEKVVESNEAFMSRRSTEMSGIIGGLSARLGIVKDELKNCYTYEYANVEFLKQEMLSMHKEIVESLIKYNQKWAEMQRYDEGDYGKECSDREIAELTTELEALKTLAL